MKRSTFLAILSLIPFFRKKKSIAEQFNVPEARLQDYEQATFTNLKKKQEEFLIELSNKFVIKGEDLVAVLKNNNNRKG